MKQLANMNINILILFLSIILISYILLWNKVENFDIKRQIFDYQFPMNPVVFKDSCKLQGLIDQLENPNIDSCYITNYIPYLFDVGDYKSDVMPL